MRSITPQLTSELQEFYGTKDASKAPAYPVDTYADLVRVVAKLAHANADHLLFYRGQAEDFKNKAGSSTFYPSIYRADPLPANEISLRFTRLRFQGERLADLFLSHGMTGAEELKSREILQWSLLQHYEVGLTPLLDLTHSLTVACSFATDSEKTDFGYVYVFGLPHIANRIAVNSEHDVINVRLLSICPPDALRPYFQEAYLAATWDVTDSYSDKSLLDFSRRLLAKFRVPTGQAFWGSEFSRVPDYLLFPKHDVVQALCGQLVDEVDAVAQPHDIGSLLLAWQRIERLLMSHVVGQTGRMTSIHRAINHLKREDVLPERLVHDLDELRHWRNIVVHGVEPVSPQRIDRLIWNANSVWRELQEVVEDGGTSHN